MREERARNPQVNACQSGGRRGVGGEEGRDTGFTKV